MSTPSKKRGEPAVRVTLEFRPVDGKGLCFDDAHGDYGPSALTAVEGLLRGMVFSILENKTLTIMSHPEELAKITEHHTRKRRECEQLYRRTLEIYDQDKAIVEQALKTARFDVVTNWNYEDQ